MLKLSKVTLKQDFSKEIDKIINNLVKEEKTVSIIARKAFFISEYNSINDIHHVDFANESRLILSNGPYNSILEYNPSAIIINLEGMKVTNNKYELDVLIMRSKELSDKGIEVYILVNEDDYNEVSKIIG